MKLVSSIALSLFIASSEAFGPAAPVSGTAFGVSSSNNGAMTMRVSISDMGRRQSVKSTLEEVGGLATKEAVEQKLLTPQTSALIEKSNWKLRKAMLRKVKNLANKYDVEVDPSFGVP